MQPPNPYAAPNTTKSGHPNAPPPKPLANPNGRPQVWISRIEKISRVCLRCGTCDHVKRVNRKFRLASGKVSGVGMGAGLVGALVANSVRAYREYAFVFALGFAAIATVAIVVEAQVASYTHLKIPLCESCVDSWDSGVRIRQIGVGVLCAEMVALSYGFAEYDNTWMAFVGVLIGITLAGIAAARLPKRFLILRGLTETHALLSGVAFETEMALANASKAKLPTDI